MTDDPRNGSSSAREALAAEAARLKHAREAAAAAQTLAAQLQAERQALERGQFSARRLRASVSRPWKVGLALTGLAAAALFWWGPHEDGEPTGPPLPGLAILLAVPSLGLLVDFFTGPWRLRRWRARLPFALTGLEALLGGGQAVTQATLQLVFTDTPVKADTLAELVHAHLGASTTVAGQALRADELSREAANWPLAQWTRRAVDRVLRRVHPAYPLARVEVRAEKTDDFYVGGGD